MQTISSLQKESDKLKKDYSKDGKPTGSESLIGSVSTLQEAFALLDMINDLD